MIILDTNVLVYSHRKDSVNHERHLDWLMSLLEGEAAFGISDLTLSSFIRIATHPKVFKKPSTPEEAIQFSEQLREHPLCVPIVPGDRHWKIFVSLCRQLKASGNLIPDCYLAAMVIECGGELASSDGDFARFPGLRWRHPLS